MLERLGTRGAVKASEAPRCWQPASHLHAGCTTLGARTCVPAYVCVRMPVRAYACLCVRTCVCLCVRAHA